MNDAAETLGGIDIVVHNATASGQPGDGPEPWLNNFEIDLLGMVGMSEGALPYLEQSDRAALVQIATWLASTWPRLVATLKPFALLCSPLTLVCGA